MSFCHHLFFYPNFFLQASSSFIIIKIIITFLEQTIKLKYFHGYLSFSTIKFLLYFSFNFNVMEATSWEIYIYFCINKALLSDFVFNFRVEDQIIKHQTRCLLPMFYLSVSIIPGYIIFLYVYSLFYHESFLPAFIVSLSK